MYGYSLASEYFVEHTIERWLNCFVERTVETFVDSSV